MPVMQQVKPARPMYNWLMKTFIAQNGREVAKIELPSGGTGYIDTSIPPEALAGWTVQLKNKLISLLDPNDPADRAELERLKSIP